MKSNYRSIDRVKRVWTKQCQCIAVLSLQCRATANPKNMGHFSHFCIDVCINVCQVVETSGTFLKLFYPQISCSADSTRKISFLCLIWQHFHHAALIQMPTFAQSCHSHWGKAERLCSAGRGRNIEKCPHSQIQVLKNICSYCKSLPLLLICFARAVWPLTACLLTVG